VKGASKLKAALEALRNLTKRARIARMSLEVGPGGPSLIAHFEEGKRALNAGERQIGTFLPLLGREVPRDLSPLKPILFGGSWEGWKGGLGPPPGGEPECANVRSA